MKGIGFNKYIENKEGFPQLIWNGQDERNQEILVSELLSFNLESLL